MCASENGHGRAGQTPGVTAYVYNHAGQPTEGATVFNSLCPNVNWKS